MFEVKWNILFLSYSFIIFEEKIMPKNALNAFIIITLTSCDTLDIQL